VKEVFLLAVERSAPVPLEVLRPAFEDDAEGVSFTPAPDGQGFTVEVEDTRIEVRFDTGPLPEGWSPELFNGHEDSLRLLGQARGFYRIAFEPGLPQPTLAVFEALLCARTLLQHVDGVLVDLTTFKVHDAKDVVDITELEFDIRDHINLHAVQVIEGDTPLWVHTHGMEKFGQRDLEVFHLAEEDLPAVESFLHELCSDLAFGDGPRVRAEVGTSEGRTFILVPSEEARATLMGVPLEAFEGHEGLYLTVVSPAGRHTASEIFRPYRERFAQEPPEKTAAMHRGAQVLLPALKSRFLRRGLMESLSFLVRAPFETHPRGEGSEPVVEQLWLEVLTWEDTTVVGRLVDGSEHTTEWRKGANVEIPEEEVNAFGLTREGRPLDEEEMRQLLVAERPM
jgi:hypothetical protein